MTRNPTILEQLQTDLDPSSQEGGKWYTVTRKGEPKIEISVLRMEEGPRLDFRPKSGMLTLVLPERKFLVQAIEITAIEEIEVFVLAKDPAVKNRKREALWKYHEDFGLIKMAV